MIQKIQNARKNNKAFSLVELIIVIAIMVALIAVMAPQFVKYVQKSRDSALAQAAEDFYATVKTEYADNGYSVEGDIVIAVDDGELSITSTAITETTTPKLTELITAAGTENGKSMGNSGDEYTITIDDNGQTITMAMTMDDGEAVTSGT